MTTKIKGPFEDKVDAVEQEAPKPSIAESKIEAPAPNTPAL